MPWPVLPDIVAESPTARRLCKGYRLWVIGYRMGFFGTMVGMVLPPRRNAQIIKKKDDAHVLHELCLRNLNSPKKAVTIIGNGLLLQNYEC